MDLYISDSKGDYQKVIIEFMDGGEEIFVSWDRFISYPSALLLEFDLLELEHFSDINNSLIYHECDIFICLEVGLVPYDYSIEMVYILSNEENNVLEILLDSKLSEEILENFKRCKINIRYSVKLGKYFLTYSYGFYNDAAKSGNVTFNSEDISYLAYLSSRFKSVYLEIVKHYKR